MKTSVILGAALMVLGLAGCEGDGNYTGTGPDRNVPDSGVSEPVKIARDYNVAGIRVTVPKTLVVNEANLFYPQGDIVWRGDAPGDRHAQIRSIFEQGFGRGAADLHGSRPVIVDVTVTRFHSLSEKTRATVGGIHSIRFTMTVRDAQSGAIIEEPRDISADLAGYGGTKAFEADRRGETMKVRITAWLAQVIKTQLGNYPSGS